jgi:hypothetical protein
VNLITHLHPVPKSRKVELYLHSAIRSHGELLNYLGIATNINFTLILYRVFLINGIKTIQVVEDAKMSILRYGTYSRKCHRTALINVQTSGVAPEGYANQQ